MNEQDLNDRLTERKSGPGWPTLVYTWEEVKSKHLCSDTHRVRAEVAAEFLLKNNYVRELQKVACITRDSTYDIPREEITVRLNTGRNEDNLAKALQAASALGLRFGELGTLVAFQVPLKNRRDDEVGKIDLVGRKDQSLWLIEFKYSESTESLLRAVCEVATYAAVLDEDKFTRDVTSSRLLDGPFTLSRAVLLFNSGAAVDQARDLRSMPALASLIRGLNVRVFTLQAEARVLEEVVPVGNG